MTKMMNQQISTRISDVIRTATSVARAAASQASNALWRSIAANHDEPYDPRYDAQSPEFNPCHDLPVNCPTLEPIDEGEIATPQTNEPQTTTPVEHVLPLAAPTRTSSRLRFQTAQYRDSAGFIAPLDTNLERHHIENFMPEHEITYRCDGIDYACNAAVDLHSVPQNHKEALASPDWRNWKAAEEAEVAQLLVLKTWTVAKPPSDHKVIPGRWTYARKTDAAGNIVRWKARWVLKGFNQVEGIDYDESSSNVIKVTSLRAILAAASSRKLIIEQADAVNAYVQAKLERPIWAVEPEGYVTQPGHAAHVHKALYGLNQSGHEWELHCKKKIAELGWRQSAHDPCVFTRGQGQDMEFLGTYVDDFIAATTNQERMDKIMQELASKMNLKRMGTISYILGIKITRNKGSDTLTLTQNAYTDKLPQKFPTKKTSGTMTNNQVLIKGSSEQS
ncbi:hypothetical protein LEN26_021274 [Aphanomyces euteiches]|nr:hypothetical protein LEN26_021274 [Aphanomyces euteiches]KAH9106482.1 hypothetical protein AeMF1_017904 [Aphanomyces euteiches]